MHSRVFEIYKDKEERFNLNEDYVFEAMINYGLTAVDYTVETPTTQDEGNIQWLGKHFNFLTIKDKTFTLDDNTKMTFLSKKVDKIKEIADNITVSGLLEDRFQMDLYKLKEAISESYGFYFMYGGILYTIEDLFSYCYGATFHIGKIFDYHS